MGEASDGGGQHSLTDERKDWSKLNIPDRRIFINARIEGVPKFIIGWDASILAEVFAKCDLSMPAKMDRHEFLHGQETVRHNLIGFAHQSEKLSAIDQHHISTNAMMLIYFGFLRMAITDYDSVVEDIRVNESYHMHVVCDRKQWVFFGSIKDESDRYIDELVQSAAASNITYH